MNDLIQRRPGALAIHAAVAQRTTTVEKVVRDTLECIAALEPHLQAWTHLDPEAALARARALDARLASGASIGLLGGVPLAVKDILDTADMPTRCGSRIYAGRRPAVDAQIVHSARQAGAVAIGKTVTTEFAYFTPGPTANPWNPAHTPGGSSSGSAAAVASGMVPLAFGTQTAGSLIRPASYCGVFGLKVTHGAMSTRGAKALSPSLDTIGWLANSADDLELMRAALLSEPFEPLPEATGMRLLACRTFEWPSSEAAGVAVWDEARRRLTRQARVDDLVLPEGLSGLMQAQKTVMAFEAARHLAAEVEQHPAELSRHIHQLYETGRSVTSEQYGEALAAARNGRAEILALMGDADALLVPAATGEAPAGLDATGDPVFSRVWTLLGLPCVNVPGLTGPGGLPVGLQLVGRPNDERRLLGVAAALHRVLRP